MKIEKDACSWCWSTIGEMELFEHELLMHRKCFEQAQIINPKAIEELKNKEHPE